MKLQSRLCALGAAAFAAATLALPSAAPAEAARPKVVFLAGELDDHPKNTHEYEKSALLLELLLKTSPNAPKLATEVCFGGWPENSATLDDAAAIVVISGGSDRNLADHPLFVGERMAALERQMRRGCGLVVIHWSTFAPREGPGEKFLEWIGGHFDYESGPPPRRWASAIQTLTAEAKPASPAHPVSRGLAPFAHPEEWYYRIRFRENDPRLAPILNAEIPGEAAPQTVAWAVERADGGRGFGTTGGHFYRNYFEPNFRRMLLNAIVWAARAEVPAGGVEAADADPIEVVILTGRNHPAHDWKATSAALREVIERDPRAFVEIKEDPEFLASPELLKADVLVQNYVNWEAPGLSAAAKANFLRYLSEGGGLCLVHFANGAFHFSLPGAPPDADWPEYRTRIVRRAWDHSDPKVGHDPYGPFRARISDPAHPILAGASDFDTVDELYFRQSGDAPIRPILMARSSVTGNEEPLAWTYEEVGARVFQTLLGHSAESILTPGQARMLARGAAWVAGRSPAEPRPISVR